MKRTILVVVLILGFLFILGTTSEAKQEKITICHATNSVQNPYVQIEVAESAVDGEGKNDHSHHSRDIIPDVLNWDEEGQAIWNNGCRVVAPSPSPTVTVSPTPSPSPTISPNPTSTVDSCEDDDTCDDSCPHRPDCLEPEAPVNATTDEEAPKEPRKELAYTGNEPALAILGLALLAAGWYTVRRTNV